MFDKRSINEHIVHMNRTILSPLTKSFVAIVESGSITGAANQLCMAKSAISQNLKQLEDFTGVKLAIRTTRSLSLTPAGQRYYERCKEIIALSERARNEMENYGATPAGPMRVTAPHAMINPIIAPSIAQLVDEFPLIQPEIIADDRRLNIIENSIDLAITIGVLNDSTLMARKIGSMRDILCMSEKLANKFELSQSPPIEKIRTLPYISHSRQSSTQIEVFLQHRQKDEEIELRFNPSMIANTVESVLAMTRHGLGVALLPSFLVGDALDSGSLKELLPNYQLKEKNIHAVHAYGRQVPMSINGLAELIKQQLRRHV